MAKRPKLITIGQLEGATAWRWGPRQLGLSMVQAILFDLAGTLLHFADVQPRELFWVGARDTWQYLHAQGISAPPFDIYAGANLRAFKRRYIWSNLRRRDFNAMDVMIGVLEKFAIGLPTADLRTLAWMWYQPVAQHATVEPGTHAMLETFRRSGLKLAIVSNTCAPGYCLDRHLEREKLLQYFPIRVYSSHTVYRKPHPEIFRTALGHLGVTAQQAVFVGDLIGTDIKGARRVGMKTVWKRDGHAVSPARRKWPDHVIKNLTDLTAVLPKLGP